MASEIGAIMTRSVVALDASMHVADAARRMRDHDIGDVVVTIDGKIHGIVTDRDIVLRCVAEGGDASTMALDEVCTPTPHTVRATDDVGTAIQLIEEHAIRRLPVVNEAGSPVGFLSLGDLAERLDRKSALGRVSAAPPSH